MTAGQGGMALYVPGARPIGTWDTKQKSLRPREFVGYCTKVQYP